MELIQQCYHYLFWGALVFLGLGLLAVMVYIIRARLTSDRIIGINLTGTLVAIIIAILAYLRTTWRTWPSCMWCCRLSR